MVGWTKVRDYRKFGVKLGESRASSALEGLSVFWLALNETCEKATSYSVGWEDIVRGQNE